MLRETGTRPKIFLANLGTPSDFSARATFARNFFGAGGIEAIESATSEGDSTAALVTAFKSSGAKLACLCSSDEVYARQAAGAAKALIAAGARHVYLAGQPHERESEFKAAGIGTFVFAGCNALHVLRDVHKLLGLEE